MFSVERDGSVPTPVTLGTVKEVPTFTESPVLTVTESPVDKLVYASISSPKVGADPTLVTLGTVKAVPALAEPTDMAVPRVGAVPFVKVTLCPETDAVAAVPALVTFGIDLLETEMFGIVNAVPRVGADPTLSMTGMAV